MRNNTIKKKSVQRAVYNIDRALKNEVKDLTCPYCGKRMIFRPTNEVLSYRSEGYMFVCSNYPTCDTYCRARKEKDKIYLISTPASRQLRIMRNEAHYYLTEIERSEIYPNVNEVYKAISVKLPLDVKKIHIGECREYMCTEICKALIDILYANKDRVEKFKLWQDSCLQNNEEYRQKLKTLTYYKNSNEKKAVAK